MTVTFMSPEDKPYWCEQGERDERDFVHLVAPAHGLTATINPQKPHDRFAPDLLVHGKLADLKTQRMPFFTAGRYGFDPQFTVTLNVGDVDRYQALGDDFSILFWVRWDTLARQFGQRSYTVRPLEGIWHTSVGDVLARVAAGDAPLHTYLNRMEDSRGNARASYLLDLGWMHHLPHDIDREVAAYVAQRSSGQGCRYGVACTSGASDRLALENRKGSRTSPSRGRASSRKPWCTSRERTAGGPASKTLGASPPERTSR
jgi:hypothetical protein